MKQIKLNVEGIECAGCENRIKKAVINIEKVMQVVASHVEGTVLIDAEEGVNETQIKEKINDLGFIVKE